MEGEEKLIIASKNASSNIVLSYEILYSKARYARIKYERKV